MPYDPRTMTYYDPQTARLLTQYGSTISALRQQPGFENYTDADLAHLIEHAIAGSEEPQISAQSVPPRTLADVVQCIDSNKAAVFASPRAAAAGVSGQVETMSDVVKLLQYRKFTGQS